MLKKLLGDRESSVLDIVPNMVKLDNNNKTAISFMAKGNDDGGSTDSTKSLLPVHYMHELPQADEERLERLFKALDRDGNGRIDIQDLSAALKDIGLSHKYAEVIIKVIGWPVFAIFTYITLKCKALL